MFGLPSRYVYLGVAFCAAIFLGIGANLAATGGNVDSNTPKIYQENMFPNGKAVRVGVSHNPPIGLHGNGGPPQGFVIELIRDVAEAERWNLSYIEKTWPELLKSLDSGEIDLLGGVAYTPARARKYDFSNETAANNWAVVYRGKNLAINGIADLEGRRIALIPNGVHTDSLKQLSQSFEFYFDLIPARDYAHTLELVDSGKADAGVVARTFHILHGSEYEALATNVRFNPIELRFAAPKGTGKELLSALDTYISTQRNDPSSRYRQSLAHWFKGSTKAVVPTWIYWISGGIVVLLCIAWLGIVWLRQEVRIRTRELMESEQKFRQLAENTHDFFLARVAGLAERLLHQSGL